MSLFDYKHENIKQKKIINSVSLIEEEESIETLEVTEIDTIEETLKEINSIKKYFNNLMIENLNENFDADLLSALNVFNDFLKDFNPEIDSYITDGAKGKNASLRSLIDALDYLENEFAEVPLYENGMIDDSKLYYDNDYTISSNGIIKQGGEEIFNPAEPCEALVERIDFANMKIIVAPGLHIPFGYILGETDNITNFKDQYFKEKVLLNDPSSNFKSLKDKEIYEFTDEEIEKYLVLKPTNNTFFNELILKNAGIVGNKAIILNVDGDITLDELLKTVGITNYSAKLKEFTTSTMFNPNNSLKQNAASVCEAKTINYFRLMFCLMIGGGTAGVAPLVKERSQRMHSDVSAGSCHPSDYDTWHSMMYSSDKKQGLEKSLLQFVYPFIHLIRKINIPRIAPRILPSLKIWEFDIKITKLKIPIGLEFKEFEIYKGLCLFGYLEQFVLHLQVLFSTEINNMFACTNKYFTPVKNTEGIGIEIKESLKPICKYFKSKTITCTGNVPSVNKNKCSFNYCTSGTCNYYSPNDDLYQSNKSFVDSENLETEGSASAAIINGIENVSDREKTAGVNVDSTGGISSAAAKDTEYKFDLKFTDIFNNLLKNSSKILKSVGGAAKNIVKSVGKTVSNVAKKTTKAVKKFFKKIF